MYNGGPCLLLGSWFSSVFWLQEWIMNISGETACSLAPRRDAVKVAGGGRTHGMRLSTSGTLCVMSIWELVHCARLSSFTLA